MTDGEKRVSIVQLEQQSKAHGAAGDYTLAALLRDSADEIKYLRDEVVRLKKTVMEVRSIANLCIQRRM